MCFSATASFAASAVLIPAGVYCITAAVRKRSNAWPLSLVPLAFGIQQLSEGFVWHGLEHDDAGYARQASLIFLFFALAFWPIWFPLVSTLMDPRPMARKIFLAFTLFSSSWFWVLYLPLAIGPESLLHIEQKHHSIYYDFLSLPVYQYVPLLLMRVLYFSCVAIPMAFGTGSLGRMPSLLFGATAIIAAVVYNYAFVSVWCFLAAWLSIYLCWYFYWAPDESGKYFRSVASEAAV